MCYTVYHNIVWGYHTMKISFYSNPIWDDLWESASVKQVLHNKQELEMIPFIPRSKQIAALKTPQ